MLVSKTRVIGSIPMESAYWLPLDTKIKDVNNLDNLVYLCPNHHILFDRNKLSKEDISHIMSLA